MSFIEKERVGSRDYSLDSISLMLIKIDVWIKAWKFQTGAIAVFLDAKSIGVGFFVARY